MRKSLFPLLIALSALTVSGSAAFYSVFGLSKLFAGASTQVIIMAGSLEFAKLVVASLLYQYWDTINKWLRTYLSIACFVLMLITSGGIYGSLSNPQQVSWYDKNSETVITSTSSSARRALQAELKTTITDRDNINIKIETVMDSINKTDIVLLDKEISNEAESELGPLKYLSETTGYPMNQVVNWFLLLIIFVFDPLAIALVVAANMAFAQIRKPEIDFDLDNPPPPNYKLKKAAEKYKEIKIEKEDVVVDDMEDLEKRMNIIGQNGNDGLHYDERYLEKLNKIVDRELSEEETIKDIVEAFQEDDEIDEWMRQLGKSKEEELEKSKEALSIIYNDEDVPFNRITDTTKTFVDNTNGNNELDDEGTTLRYKGR